MPIRKYESVNSLQNIFEWMISMKIVTFSDLHGNKYALDEFLRELKNIKYDLLVFCGDIFGYYYDQQYIIDKLLKLDKLIWLKGNHDEYFVSLWNKEADEKEYIEKYGHSYKDVKSRFSSETMQMISELPSKMEIKYFGKRIGIFHGTPKDSLMGRLYPNTEAEEKELYEKYDLVILGHTHFKMQRNIGNTLVVNPGALGQPRDAKGYGYAIIDTDSMEVVFKNVEINKSELYKKIDANDPDLKKLKEVLERKELKY